LRIPLLISAAVLVAAAKLGLLRKGAFAQKKAVPVLSEKDAEPIAPSPKAKVAPRRVVGQKPAGGKTPSVFNPVSDKIQPVVFYFSLGGVTEAAAQRVQAELEEWRQASTTAASRILPPLLLDLSYTEYDDYFIAPPKSDPTIKYFYLILSPSYNIDSALNNFLEHLEETHHDFRIDTAPLSGLLGFSVFGFGDTEGWPTEEEGFCSQAQEIDKWMAKLTGRKRAFPLGLGDIRQDWKIRMEEWRLGVQEVLLELQTGNGLGEGARGSGNAEESDVEDMAEDELPVVANTSRKRKPKANLDDVEDLGRSYRNGDASSAPLAIDFTTYGVTKPVAAPEPKEMVPKSSPTYAALTKQGYTIVGSHSGVKICRWTKSALRGRGSCYKYSFYGIKSHLCMETTPSLSCSNKCVFCWRHGTNPVGTTWRWKVDPPEMIFEGAKEGHYKKIKMLKGVPGVRAERFAEAMRIRHCALSLVGEPIFYPHINKFLQLLHKEHISSFLVCNAQHPEQLEALGHVTQLYVSIDASNKESLKKIDRPLHRDFWERFQRCLDILREKRFQQRTVFRLTLVKGFNIEDEAEGYAELVARGLPCFVEIKGVTFCGTSTSSSAGLTMQNVPFYEEVCDFVRALSAALVKRGLDYGIAAEHAHSCCVLLGSSRFNIDGKWHTTIGYDKFFECLESGEEFGPEDYIGEPTPEWALWGNGGFDPRDERHYRKQKNKPIAES
jgi:tRNA wybutosine-synthesizing protein 1